MMSRLSNRWALLLPVVLAAACSTTDYYRTQIRIPRQAEVRLTEFESILFANFILPSETDQDKSRKLDFDLNQEIQEYFTTELEVALERQVDLVSLPIRDEEAFQNPDFWKKQGPENSKSLIISGTAGFAEETRKALISGKRKEMDDPFPARKNLETRKFYTLNMHIHVLDSESGASLYNRKFKESRAYTNPNQTSLFAFYDLAFEVKEKFFREITGGERLQDRYLIIR
jgi:hypothetical protein